MSNYFNLFIRAGITHQRDQESYIRRLAVVLDREGISESDIVGLGERGTGESLDLYVVHRKGITLATERGLFKKRIEVQRVCALDSIARVRGTQEGFKGRDVTITGEDANGNQLFKIVWGLSGPDWVEPMVHRQREHLFKVIGEAMDAHA